MKKQYVFTEENAMQILQAQVGEIFAQVLEDAGVFKCDAHGRARFLRFVNYVNGGNHA